MTLNSMAHFYNFATLTDNDKKHYSSIPLEYWNPGRVSDDCVARSICRLTNLEYNETINQLKQYEKELNIPFVYTEIEVYGDFLIKKCGAKKIDSPLIINKMNGYNFCNTFTDGCYLVRVHNHVYAVVNGCAYDQWNALGEIITDLWFIDDKETKKMVQETQNSSNYLDNYKFWNRR